MLFIQYHLSIRVHSVEQFHVAVTPVRCWVVASQVSVRSLCPWTPALRREVTPDTEFFQQRQTHHWIILIIFCFKLIITLFWHYNRSHPSGEDSSRISCPCSVVESLHTMLVGACSECLVLLWWVGWHPSGCSDAICFETSWRLADALNNSDADEPSMDARCG